MRASESRSSALRRRIADEAGDGVAMGVDGGAPVAGQVGEANQVALDLAVAGQPREGAAQQHQRGPGIADVLLLQRRGLAQDLGLRAGVVGDGEAGLDDAGELGPLLALAIELAEQLDRGRAGVAVVEHREQALARGRRALGSADSAAS
jgi:hypothetical protein